jgi:DNA-directed RNA polymerase subunit F
MEDKPSPLRQRFHNLNNWLNKITVYTGQLRYNLQTKALDPENLEEEKKRLIKSLDDIEGYAFKIADILKDLKKELE